MTGRLEKGWSFETVVGRVVKLSQRWSYPSCKCLVWLNLSVLKDVRIWRTVCFAVWSSPSKVTTFYKMKRIKNRGSLPCWGCSLKDLWLLTFSFFRQDLIFNNRWKQLCLKHVPSCLLWNLPAIDDLGALKAERTPFWQTQAWVKWV